MQSASAQIITEPILQITDESVIEQSVPAQIVQPRIGQLPKILEFTTLTNHIEILSRSKSHEERLFYILYVNKEHLASRELQRCISNQTYSTQIGH